MLQKNYPSIGLHLLDAIVFSMDVEQVWFTVGSVTILLHFECVSFICSISYAAL